MENYNSSREPLTGERLEDNALKRSGSFHSEFNGRIWLREGPGLEQKVNGNTAATKDAIMEAHDQHDDRSPFALLFCRHRMLPTFELRVKIASFLLFPPLDSARELGAKRIAKELINRYPSKEDIDYVEADVKSKHRKEEENRSEGKNHGIPVISRR